MIWDIFLNVVCPFMGTIAFAVLFSVPSKYFISCGLTGLMGWLAYYFTEPYVSIAIASFFGALVVVLISRILTVRKKCPITIFLVAGIFPLIPGSGVYYTAYYLVTNQLNQAAFKGLESLKIAFAIVIGIVVIVSIPRQFFSIEYWVRKWKRKGEFKND
ncbi:uncharacterized membrane protein YjjB (DUF3815 family) [Aequitasia blattaphilus]|uniref:Threonine/serine exporter family protein n=1 Tax=Aequitasia blattaphilus TaxID=2949332 RepID=A0ABT1E6P4_9FIRM|nr:threonine/serine exporter family protein [Aequitasia blattaphilus]MCP1101506.1 threonine/serine exporter family protein [Aequitasia blattaphilus]MCR8614146.1 threonine/serine exporter family protein [Aequitasia blattaphilus]